VLEGDRMLTFGNIGFRFGKLMVIHIFHQLWFLWHLLMVGQSVSGKSQHNGANYGTITNDNLFYARVS
jgi:hypothetical protein